MTPLELAHSLERRAIALAERSQEDAIAARHAIDLLELAKAIGEAASYPRVYQPLASLELNQEQSR